MRKLSQEPEKTKQMLAFEKREKEIISSAPPTPIRIKKFQKLMWDFYKKEGRAMPWRHTNNLYHVMVSEIMLQQTQVKRVFGFYERFLKKFPTIHDLASSPLKDVLIAWQGLGYNRRAKFLHEAAKIMDTRGVPQTIAELQKLPGIGYNTACSTATFTYNMPVVFVETNIRTIMIYFFAHHKENINDKEILSLVAKTLPKKNYREWYYALMDYGSFLKSRVVNPSRQSKHHQKQSKFEGSDRQIRGKIIKTLLTTEMTLVTLAKKLKISPMRLSEQIKNLTNEKMIAKKGNKYSLPH